MGSAGLPGLMTGCFGLLGLAVWDGVLKETDDFDVLLFTLSTLWRGRRITNIYIYVYLYIDYPEIMSALKTNKCTSGFMCVFPTYKFGLGTHALNCFVVDLVHLVVFFVFGDSY